MAAYLISDQEHALIRHALDKLNSVVESHSLTLDAGHGDDSLRRDRDALAVAGRVLTNLFAGEILSRGGDLPVQDAECPRCKRVSLEFHPERAVVDCSYCGWFNMLTAGEIDDLVFALAGASDTPVPEFVRMLTAA